MHQCKDKRTKTICDKKRRKRIRQHWVLHRCINARTKEQKLYASRKEGRGFSSIGDCIDASMQGQKNKYYMRKEKGKRNCQHWGLHRCINARTKEQKLYASRKGEEDSPALGIA